MTTGDTASFHGVVLDARLQQSASESSLDLNDRGSALRTQKPHSPGPKRLSCPYQGCTKLFNRQARLTEHLRSHTNERPFRCHERECNKAFLRDSHLKHHLKSAHTDERDYCCSRNGCSKKFATGTRLRRHEASHGVKEKYTCKGFEGCSETFRKHATLSRHILAVHEGKKPFRCTEMDGDAQQKCTLGFDNAEKLRSHHRAMHDQSRFICTICGPPFGDEPGVEHQNQVSFATYAVLQRHIAERHPPMCPRCLLLCTSDKDLRRHLELEHDLVDPRKHINKSFNFACNHPSCGRAFSKRGNLNVHVRTVHEGRKDFVCGEADLGLSRLDSRIEDAKGQSEGREEVILGCERRFSSKATLEEHVRTVHLGQDSKRQQRNKRKRAEKGVCATTDSNEDQGEREERVTGERRAKRQKRPTPNNSNTTTRRPQKSAIADLTGSASAITGSNFEPPPPTISNPFDVDRQLLQQLDPQCRPRQDSLSQAFHFQTGPHDLPNASPSLQPCLPPQLQQPQHIYGYDYDCDPFLFTGTVSQATDDEEGEEENNGRQDKDQDGQQFAKSILNSSATSSILVDPVLMAG